MLSRWFASATSEDFNGMISCRTRLKRLTRCVRSSIRVPLLAIVALVSSLSPLLGQAAGTRHLAIITPDNPGFTKLLAEFYPGIEDISGFSTVRPYLVMLRSYSSIDIEAYCLQYRLVNTDISSYNPGCVRFIHDRYAPKTNNDSRPLQAGDIYLIAPTWLRASPQDYVTSRAAISSSISELATGVYSEEHPVVQSVIIDAVIYADGSYSGPDTTFLLESYKAALDAQKDENTAILQSIDSGMTEEAITHLLTSDINAGLSVDLSPTHNPVILYQQDYKDRRGREAQKLLSIYKQRGLRNLKSFVRSNVARRSLTFTPLPLQ
jgi:hypothetical protein